MSACGSLAATLGPALGWSALDSLYAASAATSGTLTTTYAGLLPIAISLLFIAWVFFWLQTCSPCFHLSTVTFPGQRVVY